MSKRIHPRRLRHWKHYATTIDRQDLPEYMLDPYVFYGQGYWKTQKSWKKYRKTQYRVATYRPCQPPESSNTRNEI